MPAGNTEIVSIIQIYKPVAYVKRRVGTEFDLTLRLCAKPPAQVAIAFNRVDFGTLGIIAQAVTASNAVVTVEINDLTTVVAVKQAHELKVCFAGGIADGTNVRCARVFQDDNMHHTRLRPIAVWFTSYRWKRSGTVRNHDA